MRKTMFAWVLMAAVAAGAASAWAAAGTPQAQPQAKPAAQAAADEEERFDEELRQFGYYAGIAFQCVPDAKQAATERQILDVFNNLTQLFGSDRAFFFAVSFGNGTAGSFDKAKCPEFLKKFEEAVAKSRTRR